MFERSPPTSAGPSDRAGLTDAPLNGMPAKWMTTRVSGIASGARLRRALRDRQDDEQEEGGQQHLDAERPHRVAADGRPRAVDGPADLRLIREQQQDRGGPDRSEHLGDDVARGVHGRDPAVEQRGQRDGRVVVPARDVRQRPRSRPAGPARSRTARRRESGRPSCPRPRSTSTRRRRGSACRRARPGISARSSIPPKRRRSPPGGSTKPRTLAKEFRATPVRAPRARRGRGARRARPGTGRRRARAGRRAW